MVTIYDKDGIGHEKHAVDARECLETGRYTAEKVISSPAVAVKIPALKSAPKSASKKITRRRKVAK